MKISTFFLLSIVVGLWNSRALATITYDIGMSSLVGKTSTDGTLSGMEVRVGRFNTGFTATAANYNSWAANFSLLTPSVESLIDDGGAFVSATSPDTGPFIMSNNSPTLTSNPSGFTGGEQIYMWISNSLTAGVSTQAALLTDTNWIYTAVTGGFQSPVTLALLDENPTLLFGTSFNDHYIDPFTEVGIRLVTQNIAAVPEPTISCLTIFGTMFAFMRRRRRQQA